MEKRARECAGESDREREKKDREREREEERERGGNRETICYM